ncbi:hypothetical protein GCM10009760_36090 [Kitasatospora kazusensis]|uniref:Uncharacterized protein n=1 Tax=Kitasatospora kazusensis TaxID=407974 RepID=A0ABN2ZS62_9ACTN
MVTATPLAKWRLGPGRRHPTGPVPAVQVPARYCLRVLAGQETARQESDSPLLRITPRVTPVGPASTTGIRGMHPTLGAHESRRRLSSAGLVRQVSAGSRG